MGSFQNSTPTMKDTFVNMIPENFIDRLSSFLLLSSLCCINRSFWFQKRKLKILGHVFFLTSATAVIASLTIDIFYENNEEDQETFPVLILWINLFETLLIAIGAMKFTSCHETMKILDEKCYIPRSSLKNDTFENIIGQEPSTMVLIRIFSIIGDVVVMKILNYSMSLIIVLSIGFAAHDTELVFCSILINELNNKLAKLTSVDTVTGTRIYRHVLIGSSRFAENYNLLVAIIIFITLIMSIIFGVTAIQSKTMRSEGFSDLYLIIFIYWRELKYIYALWILCRAAYRTKQLCVNLAQFLTIKVVFDMDKKDKTYKLTKRWLTCVKSYELNYSDTKKYTLSLQVPLELLNLTFSNLLVISQIHKTIKKANSH